MNLINKNRFEFEKCIFIVLFYKISLLLKMLEFL